MNQTISEGISNIANALKDVVMLNAPETHEIEITDQALWLKVSANKTRTVTINDTIPSIKKNDILMFWYVEREYPVMRLVTRTDNQDSNDLVRRITVAPHF